MKYITDDGKEFNDYSKAQQWEQSYYKSTKARDIKFYGHSDDLVIVSNGKDEDEYTDRTFNLIGIGEGMKVKAVYYGCWSFAVGKLDEDIHFPDWNIKHESHGYSMVVTISVPDGVRLVACDF